MSVNTSACYRVVLFKTVSAAMKAEKLLLAGAVPHKLIPVPKSISSDCGVCIRYEACEEEAVLGTIREQVEISAIADLK
jgi:hypothetical protein